MKFKSHFAACAVAGMLATAVGLAGIPGAHANGTTYTQEVSSAETCAMMESATVDAFKASGYEVSSHTCVEGNGRYTLVIEYAH
ncbi:hypothetical protein [Glutamicibacter sp.]|uniref:hypothetical protein n=1 Tax=Glutamicibacter sp. TaxID=1931995 RepID=UPI003D6C3A5E